MTCSLDSSFSALFSAKPAIKGDIKDTRNPGACRSVQRRHLGDGILHFDSCRTTSTSVAVQIFYLSVYLRVSDGETQGIATTSHFGFWQLLTKAHTSI